MFRVVRALIKTLFDIILLRKGPEAIPRSWILLLMSVVLWLLASLLPLALIERVSEAGFVVGLFTGLIGVLCYMTLTVASGHSSRLLPMVSAVVGCSALIMTAFVVEFVLFSQLIDEEVAGYVGSLILLWSVPVEGHIIARTINRHWYIGIAIAIVVFALQFIVQRLITSPT